MKIINKIKNFKISMQAKNKATLIFCGAIVGLGCLCSYALHVVLGIIYTLLVFGGVYVLTRPIDLEKTALNELKRIKEKNDEN